MKVYLYLHYKQELPDGEDEITTEVYAKKEDAERKFNNKVVEIQESIDEEEPISVMFDDPDYFNLVTDWRVETVYYKEREVL